MKKPILHYLGLVDIVGLQVRVYQMMIEDKLDGGIVDWIIVIDID